MITQIYNGKILTVNGDWMDRGSVIVRDCIIEHITSNCDILPIADRVIDAKGGYVVPGGIDIHVHGAGDHDFMEGTTEAFETIASIHRRHGTTSLLPTLASSTYEQMAMAAETCRELMNNPQSGILGLHYEGPYFNPSKAGGQLSENIRLPEADEYMALADSFPCIRRWDAAPEMPGALDFSRYVSSKGIIAGIAHTTAGYNQIENACKAGFDFATHFYNGMTTTHNEGIYKHEGTVEAILLSDVIDIEIIGDGIHVPAPLVKLAHKIKGYGRMCLVTDALAITETDGESTFDPRVVIENGACRLKNGEALAGSCATMDRMIKAMATDAGLPLADVFRMSSETPARILGISDRKGSIAPMKDADICIYDENLNLKTVVAMGETVY